MINKYIDIYEFQVVAIIGKTSVEGIDGVLDTVTGDVNGMVTFLLSSFTR